MTAMVAKTEQKAESHTTILDSASRILRKHGIAGARVADIMKGAGLTVGGFYAHWKSKEHLIDDTIRRTASELRERLFRELDDVADAERADVVVKRYLNTKHRDANAAEGLGCPFPAIASEVATTAPEHREAVAETLDLLVKRMTELVKSRRVALGIVSLMVGGLTLARATRGTPISDEVITACRSLAGSAVG
ncbi:MAG: TetR/AcrR family transcriptional regulator [Kofleriaceae bacterium]